jgi:hypothetical protein
VLLFGLIMAILVACSLALFTGSGPFASPPATCRGVAELLQKRQMDIRWLPCSYKYPAIYIYRNDEGAGAIEAFHFEGKLDLFSKFHGGVVVICQYPKASEAREEAGSIPVLSPGAGS